MIGKRVTIRLGGPRPFRVTIVDYSRAYVAVRRWPWSDFFWVPLSAVYKTLLTEKC